MSIHGRSLIHRFRITHLEGSSQAVQNALPFWFSDYAVAIIPFLLGEFAEEFFLPVAHQSPRLHVAFIHDVIRDVGENSRQVDPGV
jgi:hypothetical protein